MTTTIPSLLQPLKDRLAAATPWPWEEYWQGHIHAPAKHPQAVAESICQTFGREDRKHPNAEFIAAAPTDQAKLIAAVEAVEALAEKWRYKGEFGWGAWQEGQGPDPEGHVLDEVSSELRAALTQALEGN
jgi:hypothetical protein